MSPERRITFSTDVSVLRRRLDPTAWVVFEELLLASTEVDGTCVASVSIRGLAGRCGLSKDTIAV